MRSFGRGYVEQIGGAFVSIQLTCLDLDDDELASLPIQYQDGRNDSWWTSPRVTSYL